MTLLQKQPGDSQEHAEDGSISLKAEVAQLRGKLATQTQDLALQVRHKNARAYPDNSCNCDRIIVQLAPQSRAAHCLLGCCGQSAYRELAYKLFWCR